MTTHLKRPAKVLCDDPSASKAALRLEKLQRLLVSRPTVHVAAPEAATAKKKNIDHTASYKGSLAFAEQARSHFFVQDAVLKDGRVSITVSGKPISDVQRAQMVYGAKIDIPEIRRSGKTQK